MRKQLLAFALVAMTAAPTLAAEAAPKPVAANDAQIARLTKEVGALRHRLAAQGAELKRLVAGLPPHSVVLCISGCPAARAPSAQAPAN